jgi:RNA polymerase sigma-70 factor (ECF subfamily)
LNEKQLIVRAQRGDRDAERALYEANVDRVYRLAFRIAGDEMLAMDFTQDSFLRAFDRIQDFRGEAKFSTWMHSIAMSVTLNGMRKVRRLRDREVSIDDEAYRLATGTAGDTLLKQRLRGAIDDLSDKLKAVFVMYELEGYQHNEIAKSLDIPEGTSKARLNRAKLKLRAELATIAPEFRLGGQA